MSASDSQTNQIIGSLVKKHFTSVLLGAGIFYGNMNTASVPEFERKLERVVEAIEKHDKRQSAVELRVDALEARGRERDERLDKIEREKALTCEKKEEADKAPSTPN